ncbi:tripartite tricarboxylate transporter substrate binding protein [Cupriavidus sp. WKF15]|uniref:Bug family tripartite tricarboxylate transporter substrate binding protein n=1 Tax=Cupriavidus sp. WKF15 TaxID=3032282 RepID=UPI0023E3505B|nr:tripartite tricarboxylate transporter substrate binding protein [Cupriavidus sp. WKF15]WER46582.1 tripartite tricarboxylate transporter substrate binding protein [Cupriavidus sp. WKF15]
MSAVIGAGTASAGEFPEKPITLVVQAAAGGAADLPARIVGQKLGVLLGVPVVVENMPAAGGIVATRRVIHANPDGYTLLVYGTKAAIAESLFKTRPYNLTKDLTPVALIGFTDLALVVDRKSPLKTVADLVAAVKAKPGQVTVGVGDTVGGIQHLGAELLKASIQGNFLIVPYGSISKLTVAVRSGEVDAAFELLPGMLPQVKGGEVRALATAGSQRNSDLPNVPTLAESGVPNAEMTTLSMIATPAGTPPAVIAKLNNAVNQALSQRDVQEALRGRGATPAAGTKPADAQRLMEGQVTRWRDAVRLAKVPLQ